MTIRHHNEHPPIPLALQRPNLAIAAVFAASIILKAVLVLCTPGPAYDTSTAVHLARLHSTEPTRAALGDSGSLLWRLCDRLTRWDAIYFTQAAHHGYRNEQEWAFGWGYVQVVVTLRQGLEAIAKRSIGPLSLILIAIVLSNVSHLLSALALYRLSTIVFPGTAPSQRAFSLISALLHILSPAGLFLSAPYSESLFSFLTMTGYCVYVKSTLSSEGLSRSLHLFISATMFSASCMVRSNGILHGIPFLIDFLVESRQIMRRPSVSRLFRIVTLGACGLLIAGGIILPQAIAWKQFCRDASMKAGWCQNTIPSVYSWIQGKYWNVGFLRYWTVSNIPLFALAAPTLLVLLKSGLWGLQTTSTATAETLILKKLALPQVILTCMAITSYHVQIITRLSSGCAVWYWYVARQIVDDKGGGGSGRLIVRWMIMYCLIQGVLFASFLPPA